MKQLIIHLGTPRTGTTVLQKHLFSKAISNIIYSKRAYKPSGRVTDEERSTFTNNNQKYKRLLEAAGKDIASVPPSTFTTEILIEASIISSNKDYVGSETFQSLCRAISILHKLSKTSEKTICISSERLCDTTASLFGYSSHKWADNFMAWESLSKAIKIGAKASPQITICLRSPIPYLRSKYIRTFIQRRGMRGERDLSPAEYIQKQSVLESNHPGTSALTPAIHSEFIKQLQKRNFVKAFGFQELLASDDVFSLMGLQGEDKYAFRDFPRENKPPFTKEQEQAIEVEITKALKQYGFYDRIMKAQMFE